ncbi:MAG: AMP-binding protein [Propionibacteriales bacterium]|nr:AMP-binding protein [Propionibacteriales bacterium]
MNLSETLPLHARYRGDQIAILDPEADRSITYRDLEELVSVGASRLINQGVREGDIVGLDLKDTVEHLVMLFACARALAVIQPVDCRWTAAEKAQALTAFRASLVVSEPDAEAVPGVPRMVVGGDDRLPDLSGLDVGVPDASDPPLILSLSSGTTGRPKGPLLRTSQFLSRFRVFWAELGLNGRSRFLSCTPLYYGGGRAFALHVLYSGGTVVLMRNPYTPERFADYAEEFRIDSAFLVPTILRRFLQAGDQTLKRMSQVETVISSGAALHADERDRLLDVFGPGFLQYYASTEGGGISLLRGDAADGKSATVGRPVLGVDVMCADDAGQEVAVGETGKIRYRGPSVANSYYGDEPVGDAFRDGWFYPGDLGSLDEDGYLRIRGRSKDMIIRGGVNIYPSDVESVLLSHPAVVECAVVGWSSKEFNEEVAAFVVLSEEVTSDVLMSICREQLARYKWPREVFAVDSLPKNALGKIRKDLLVSELPEL